MTILTKKPVDRHTLDRHIDYVKTDLQVKHMILRLKIKKTGKANGRRFSLQFYC